jgi:hypothetical protein
MDLARYVVDAVVLEGRSYRGVAAAIEKPEATRKNDPHARHA